MLQDLCPDDWHELGAERFRAFLAEDALESIGVESAHLPLPKLRSVLALLAEARLLERPEDLLLQLLGHPLEVRVRGEVVDEACDFLEPSSDLFAIDLSLPVGPARRALATS